MSQERLSSELRVSFQQIQKYERGINRIGAGRLFKIAQILGVSVEYFYQHVDEEDPVVRGVQRDLRGKTADSVCAFISTPDGLALNSAYVRIRDTKLKRQLLHFIQAMAGLEAPAE
jgi:transcriptional regulator with XRE-family HTH domain